MDMVIENPDVGSEVLNSVCIGPGHIEPSNIHVISVVLPDSFAGRAQNNGQPLLLGNEADPGRSSAADGSNNRSCVRPWPDVYGRTGPDLRRGVRNGAPGRCRRAIIRILARRGNVIIGGLAG